MRKSTILYSSSTAPRIMKVAPKITSFPAALSRNTGRPATTTRFARFAIRRCCSAQTKWMGSLPSISPTKIAERPHDLIQQSYLEHQSTQTVAGDIEKLQEAQLTTRTKRVIISLCGRSKLSPAQRLIRMSRYYNG